VYQVSVKSLEAAAMILASTTERKMKREKSKTKEEVHKEARTGYTKKGKR
jgi:uncharacterized protein YjaG (DUF416 family)